MGSVLADLRFALRGLRRDPAFTFAAIAMLAIAIGLNVTVFTVMNTMLFRGFPLVKRNGRLVYMQERYPSGMCCISYPDFEDWRSRTHSFEGMAFVATKSSTVREGDGRSLDMLTATVSANAFGLLGVPPVLGRDFVPADEVPGAAPVAILNYHFWESRFGKRADITGLTVHINNASVTIIGVMPEGFDFPAQLNLWMPLAHTPELRQRRPGGYMAFGRLRDGANRQRARAELETINRRLEAANPATNRGVVPKVDTWSQFFIGPNAPIVYGSLWAAAWFVLLIACANLANLTLARTIGREREFSIRIALGAGRGRMMRQILVESVTLASLAGALGWWIAKWSVRAWTVATASQYQVLDYTLDSGTLAYLVAISFAAAILFSLTPIGRVLQSGKRLRANDRKKPGEWRTVVGVVPNIMQGDPTRQHFKPLVYLPFRQEPAARAFFLLRTGVPPNQVAQAVRAEVQKLDPNAILEDFTTLKASFAFRAGRMDLEHVEMGKYAAVAPIFALIALLLAAIGLYAVIAHSLSQRTKEIGVRMAIGAAAEDIRSMVLRDGMLPVAIGMVLGLAAALAINRILQSQLVGVSPYDPVTMAGAPVILVLVALLACHIPARRAMKVDPVIALRHD